MPSNRSPRTTILKGQWRPFNLGHCYLDGCNNFIMSLGYNLPTICKSHMHRDYRRLKAYKDTKLHPRPPARQQVPKKNKPDTRKRLE